MDTERRRLFLGLPLSPELRKRLSRITAAWAAEALIVTREENLHVSLYYLGFVAEDEISGISTQVRAALADTQGFEIRFTTLETSPSPESPKMISLSGPPSPELLNLQNTLELTFSPYTKEKKSFRPHVTLAQIRKFFWQNLSDDKKPNLSDPVNFMEPVDTVALFESVTIDGIRRYVEIDTFHLP